MMKLACLGVYSFLTSRDRQLFVIRCCLEASRSLNATQVIVNLNKNINIYNVYSVGSKNAGPWIYAQSENKQGKFRCLIDSVADLNLIRPEHVCKIGEYDETKVVLRTANNEKMKTLGKCKLNLLIGESEISDEFIVTDEIKMNASWAFHF
ncbi:hypothetical protein NGRA_2276 [Nosema granulosis]|uniref:Uncharacterized protein n=1 Tax=Nosema granulosis TaxID=83296 RepID=A0A9P6KYT7_9MICR|nr:hypothetical protein NGRA_2276 [Nosema granulosis]